MAINSRTDIYTSHIRQKLVEYDRNVSPLPGFESPADLDLFVSILTSQVIELLTISELQGNSSFFHNRHVGLDDFDPIAVAIWYFDNKMQDEAFWMLFLASYTGRHPKIKWKFLYEIYTSLGGDMMWTWERVSADAETFSEWLISNQPQFEENARLGDVHKHTGFDRNKAAAMGAEIMSYIAWVKLYPAHLQHFDYAVDITNGESTVAFHHLYESMNRYTRFAKSIKFNYLATVGNLGFAQIQPAHLYLNDILSPKQGARQLLGGKKKDKMPVSELNFRVQSLAEYLDLPYTIQALQNTLAKWFKTKASAGNQRFIRRY